MIESQTRGVIVPYGKGKEIIGRLCASPDIAKEQALLKQAQRYTVNCYETALSKLHKAGAVYQAQNSGIWCLLPEHYSNAFGISEDPVFEASHIDSFCL